jgi:hypothetical protein
VNGGLRSIAAKTGSDHRTSAKVKCEGKNGMVEILSFSLELDLPLSD